MTSVTIRDLRNHGGEVIDRVGRGERVIVTRSGKPVAELRPIITSRISAQALVEQLRQLPQVDPAAILADLDAIIDGSLLQSPP
jgi:prevent-host-death family protein